jgi:hypothetical protein
VGTKDVRAWFIAAVYFTSSTKKALPEISGKAFFVLDVK